MARAKNNWRDYEVVIMTTDNAEYNIQVKENEELLENGVITLEEYHRNIKKLNMCLDRDWL